MKRGEDDYDNQYRFGPNDVICKGDADQLRRALKPKIQENHAKYDTMANMVCYMGKMVPMNPEYRARAIETKRLREQLKTYSGSDEIASDLLFETKKLADAQGMDFAIAARREIDAMRGMGIDGPKMNEVYVPKPEPRKPLASRFLHWLWKSGFPVGRFIKKELDVDEASKCP